VSRGDRAALLPSCGLGAVAEPSQLCCCSGAPFPAAARRLCCCCCLLERCCGLAALVRRPRLSSLPCCPCRSEVLEGANELRIMLCRPKEASGERSSTSIVAACGIYMKVGSVRGAAWIAAGVLSGCSLFVTVLIGRSWEGQQQLRQHAVVIWPAGRCSLHMYAAAALL